MVKKIHLATQTNLNIQKAQVETVTNAEDYTLIDKAITRAKESGKPSIIEIKTMIAIGTSMQASPKGHEYVISENDLALVKEKMSITQVPYHISASSYNEFKNILEKNNTYYNEWVSTYNNIIEVNEEKKKIISLLEENKKASELCNIIKLQLIDKEKKSKN